MIQGVKLRYSDIEKATLAVMVMAMKPINYSLAHKIIVKMHLPFIHILVKSDMSGRMVNGCGIK